MTMQVPTQPLQMSVKNLSSRTRPEKTSSLLFLAPVLEPSKTTSSRVRTNQAEGTNTTGRTVTFQLSVLSSTDQHCCVCDRDRCTLRARSTVSLSSSLNSSIPGASATAHSDVADLQKFVCVVRTSVETSCVNRWRGSVSCLFISAHNFVQLTDRSMSSQQPKTKYGHEARQKPKTEQEPEVL